MQAPTEQRDGQTTDRSIDVILRLVRQHLGMDVAFVAELEADCRVFRFVDSDSAEAPIIAGDADPLEESYCHYVSTGRLPPYIPDASQHPLAADLAITGRLRIGTYLSVPVEFSDGRTYGTFCCFSQSVDDTASERDLATMRVLAALVAEQLEERERVRREQDDRRRRLAAIADGRDLQMVFQPIVHLATGEPAGLEALARFPNLTVSPEAVFEEAWQLGIGVTTEMTAFDAGLKRLGDIPQGAYLTLNVSPETLASVDLADRISAAGDPTRVVVEVTEHAAIHDYDLLIHAIRRLASAGIRLAVDDVGAGFSGLDQILRLAPAILKLDVSLIRDVDHSVTKQAMVSSLVAFAARTEARLVAECIETQSESDALRVLGIGWGQGYHFARPAPLAA